MTTQKEPYNQRDHIHCFNGQEGHEKHLRCCLCSKENSKEPEWENRFRNIGAGSVRFVATRYEMRDFIKQTHRELLTSLLEKMPKKGYSSPSTEYFDGYNTALEEVKDIIKAALQASE